MQYHISIDASALSSPTFSVPGVVVAAESALRLTARVEPGDYSIQTHGGADISWHFEVTAQGLISFDPALEVGNGGMLSGLGTTTLSVLGFAIIVDGTQLTTDKCALAGITDWLLKTSTHSLRLLPGHYGFIQPNGPVPEADLQIRTDGTVDYASGSDSFLSGRGSTTFVIAGFPITLDGTQLTTDKCALAGITDWLLKTSTHSLRLLPGDYGFIQPNGAIPEADFQVRIDGRVDYAEVQDVTAQPPGVLSGRNSHTIQLAGYQILVDASNIVGVAVFLMPYAVYISSSVGLPQVVALLPSTGLSLELRGVPPRVALFDLASGGRVLLDEAYPFVDLRWKDAKQLLTLSLDAIRQKRPCCADFAIATP